MAVEGEPRHGEETASEKDGDETIMKALPLPRSANDVVEGQISDLVVQMVPAIFGKCCWLPYQSSAVVTPSNNTIAAIFVNQKASEESIIEVQMRNLFKKQTGWTKKQVERTKSNVDLLLAMARDGNTYAHPDPQHLSDVAKAVGRIRLRRFLLNYLVYRPSTGSPVWTDALRGTMSGQLHLDFSKGDATLPYQLERMPDRIPFWKNIESYVEHFNKSTEDFERALSDRPEDIQGALAAAGRGSEAVIPERLPETTLSMFDVVHEGTVSGRARLAAAPRLLVLFLQLIQGNTIAEVVDLTNPWTGSTPLETIYPSEHRITQDDMENIVKGLILIGPSALSNDTRLLSLYSKVSPSTVFEVYMRGGHQARLKQQCRFNPVLVKAYTCFADCVWQMLTEVDLRTALPWTPRWVELRARTIRETIGLTLEAWHRWVRKDEEGKDTAETPLEWQQVRHLSQRHVVEEVMRTRAKVAAVTVPLAALFVKATEALFHTILAREEGMPGADNAVDDFFQAQNDLRTCEKQYAAVLREAFGNRLNLLEVVKEWAATVRPRNVRVAGRAEGARVGEGGAEGAEEEEGDGVDTPDPGRLATAYMLASAHWPGLRPAETEPGSACPEADPTWMFTGITGGLPAVVRIPAENIRFHPLGLQGAKAPFLVPTPGGNEGWVDAQLSALAAEAMPLEMVHPAEPDNVHPVATVTVCDMVGPAGPPAPQLVVSLFSNGPVLLTYGVVADNEDLLGQVLPRSLLLTAYDQGLTYDPGNPAVPRQALTAIYELDDIDRHAERRAFMYSWDVQAGGLDLVQPSHLKFLSMDAAAWVAYEHMGTHGRGGLQRPRMQRLLFLTPGAVVGHDGRGLCAPHGACMFLRVLRGSVLVFFSLGGASALASSPDGRSEQYAWKELFRGDEAYFPPGTLLTVVAGGWSVEQAAGVRSAAVHFGYFFSPCQLYQTLLTKTCLAVHPLATFPPEEGCAAVEEAHLFFVWREVRWRKEAVQAVEGGVHKLTGKAFQELFGNQNAFPANPVEFAAMVYMNAVSPAQLAPAVLTPGVATSLAGSWSARRVACTNDLIKLSYGSYDVFRAYWSKHFTTPNMVRLCAYLHMDGDLVGRDGKQGEAVGKEVAVAEGEGEAGGVGTKTKTLSIAIDELRLKMRESEAAARKALSLAPAAANAPQPPTTTLERTVGAGRTRVDTPSSTLDVHRPAGSTERPQESKVADVGAQTPARVAGAAVLGGGTGMLSPPPTDRRLTGGSASRQSGTPAASDNGTSVAGKRTREQSGFVGEENQESTSKKKKRTPGNGPSPAMVHVQ